MSNSSLKSDAKLLNSTIIVSSMTLISRIFGMLRDIVFARFFGVSVIMDAFIVANRIPNMLRRFFGEGAFNQGFVPVSCQHLAFSSFGANSFPIDLSTTIQTWSRIQ